MLHIFFMTGLIIFLYLTQSSVFFYFLPITFGQPRSKLFVVAKKTFAMAWLVVWPLLQVLCSDLQLRL